MPKWSPYRQAPDAVRDVPRRYTLAQFLVDAGDTSLQLPSEVLRVPHEKISERTHDSLLEVAFGWFLLVCAVPLLWFNESRVARLDCLAFWARCQCRSTGGEHCDPENRNWLVHLEGEQMKSAAAVEDPDFDVLFDVNCIRVRRLVEAFQRIEHAADGGASVHYTEEWSSIWYDSARYKDEAKRCNRTLPGLQLGLTARSCSRVEYGDCFVLPDLLVDGCEAFEDASHRLGETITLSQATGPGRRPPAAFRRRQDGFFHHRPADGGQVGGGDEWIDPESPRIGDVRVRFECVPDGPASVVALQVECKGEVRDTFAPYRLISRGFCDLPEDVEKLRLQAEARKSHQELLQEASMCSDGPSAWCCCAFTLGFACWSNVLLPQVFELVEGQSKAQHSLRSMDGNQSSLFWAWRLLGWMVMGVGLYMMVSPFMPDLVLLPLIGELVVGFGRWTLFFICAQTTVFVATVLVVLSYLPYRPLVSVYALGFGIAVWFVLSMLPMLIIAM